MSPKEDVERLSRLDEILQHEFGRERAQMLLIEQSMRELEGSLVQARKLVEALGQALQLVQERIKAHSEERRR